ncbi:MAG TPA: hypothetical protein VNH17_04170 [Streptosporangiaceae bacterium]|nr:hypothetical protein [Streptosporangiaceae bacterium]
MSTSNDDGVPHVYVQVPAAGASAEAALGAPEEPGAGPGEGPEGPEGPEQEPGQDPPGPDGDEGQEVPQ